MVCQVITFQYEPNAAFFQPVYAALRKLFAKYGNVLGCMCFVRSVSSAASSLRLPVVVRNRRTNMVRRPGLLALHSTVCSEPGGAEVDRAVLHHKRSGILRAVGRACLDPRPSARVGCACSRFCEVVHETPESRNGASDRQSLHQARGPGHCSILPDPDPRCRCARSGHPPRA